MKTNKTLYGLLAFAPFFLIIPIFVLMFSMFADIARNPYQYHGDDMPAQFPMMMLFGVLAGAVAVIGMVMYIIHVTNNRHIPDNNRIVWILVIALGGTIGMIVYFFMWIKKEDELNAKQQQGSGGVWQ